jgi:glycosyltransferase involved in cell wall biosynthesis
MTSQIKITLLTVCYNSQLTIADTIASVAKQNYKNLEYIIVDGASKDGTIDIVKRFPVVSKVVSEPDNGIYDAMNKGLSLATGEVVGLINADDFYADETVLSQVAATFKDPSVDACYADLLYVDPLTTNKVIRYWKSCDYRHGLFENGWMPAHPTFFVRRNVYEKYGNFDLSFLRQADFDLTMRFLAVHKIKSVYIPKVWIKMRVGGLSNNSISGILKGNLEAYRACRKNGLNVGYFFIARKILSRIPQYFSKSLHSS